MLHQQGNTPQVKGYETPIRINKQGRKSATTAEATNALGNETVAVGEDPTHRPGLPVKPARIDVDNRLIINLQPGDETVGNNVQRKFNRHPENTVVIARLEDGGLKVVKGKLVDDLGRVNLAIVGHGQDGEAPTAGGLRHHELLGVIEDTKALVQGFDLQKLKLAVCLSDCPPVSLKEQMQAGLQGLGYHAKVRGYDGTVVTDEAGKQHKHFSYRVEPELELTGQWREVSAANGSSDKKTYQAPDGEHWQLTPVADEHYRRASNEVLASHLYAATGVIAASKKLIWDKQNDAMLLGEHLEFEGARVEPDLPKLKKLDGAVDGFGADLWLANLGVIDASHQGIVDYDGMAVRQDIGSTMEYRQGPGFAHKALSAGLEEFPVMTRPEQNYAGNLVKGLSRKKLVESFEPVLNTDDECIDAVCKKFGPGTLQERENLADTLIKRKQILQAYKDKYTRDSARQ